MEYVYLIPYIHCKRKMKELPIPDFPPSLRHYPGAAASRQEKIKSGDCPDPRLN
jgi:hypothetical protein